MKTNGSTTTSQTSFQSNSKFADHVAAHHDAAIDMSLTAWLGRVDKAHDHLDILKAGKKEMALECLHYLKHALVMVAVSRAQNIEEIDNKIVCLVQHRRMLKDLDPRLVVILDTAIVYECELWNIEIVNDSELEKHQQIH